MPIALHVALMFLGEFAGFFVGAVFGIWLWVGRPIEMSIPLQIGVIVAALFVGVMVPRVLFRRVIPARSPAEGCGDPARPQGSRPIVYRCRRCGHVHDTGWSEGDTHDHHGH
jgi:hypothetical protein